MSRPGAERDFRPLALSTDSSRVWILDARTLALALELEGQGSEVRDFAGGREIHESG